VLNAIETVVGFVPILALAIILLAIGVLIGARNDGKLSEASYRRFNQYMVRPLPVFLVITFFASDFHLWPLVFTVMLVAPIALLLSAVAYTRRHRLPPSSWTVPHS
jgi:hypothetical protein